MDKNPIEDARETVHRLRQAKRDVEASTWLAPEIDTNELLAQLQLLVVRASNRYQDVLKARIKTQRGRQNELFTGVPQELGEDETTPIDMPLDPE